MYLGWQVMKMGIHNYLDEQVVIKCLINMNDHFPEMDYRFMK